MKKIILVLSFVFVLRIIAAQDSTLLEPKSTPEKPKNYKIIALPLIFFSPETKFGIGCAGLITFKSKKDSVNVRPSSFQTGLAYTQLKQLLIYLPFQLWFKNAKYNVNGELGYYRYNYDFFGIGTNLPFSNKERYDVTFPQVRINMLKSFAPNFYAGVRYNFENFKITQRDSLGQLFKNEIIGSAGGVSSSIGCVFKYDNRDNLFSPSKGYFAEFAAQFDNKYTGSNFNNVKFIFEASTYFKIVKKQVLAIHVYGVKGNGSIPFNQMAMLGGTKRMRGFYAGRYRDDNTWLLQTEYRIPLFWRLGMVAFVSAGDVAPKLSAFKSSSIKLAYGTGLRVALDKIQKINLRIDIAWADPKPNFYLTLIEAF